MTPLFTAPQEMAFVILTLVLFAAVIGDFRNARLFRAFRNRPSPWKDLAKEVKVFICILFACMIWAQNKMLMPGGGWESLSNVTLESVEGTGDWLSGSSLETTESGSYSMMGEGGGEAAGITWAVLSGLPPFTSNAILTANQFTGGFACVAVTNIQPSALDAPSNAVVYTDWPYAVARHSVALPQGCLPDGFTFGGRLVTNLYVAASGMLSFDGPKSSPMPATNGIPDGTAANYISVLQTPSDIVPTNGLFWYAPGTNSSVFTWKDVFLGQDTNCLATVQAELYANGDFTCRYLFPSATNNYAQLTNFFLVGAQNNSGGETVLYTNALLAINDSYLPAFELRWKSLAGLDPAVPDRDSDGFSDADELFIYHTDPRRDDTDGDGIPDAAEIANGTDPLNPDENNDGIPDGVDLTGYSLSDTNLVFKLINGIAPGVDPLLDSDNDGWADWLELRFGTDPNYFSSTPDGLDTYFSVTVTLASPPTEPGVLAVGGSRVLVTGPGSWVFWRTPGEAHPVSFTSAHGVPPPFTLSFNRPDAARYNIPVPDGKGGDFGKAALPLISFDPAISRCCHEARTTAHCQTYTAYVMPPMPGTYEWGTYAWNWYLTWTIGTTSATNAVTAGHDISWLRLRFTPSGASAYRVAWVQVNTHCNAFTNAFEGAGGTHIIFANTDDDDGDSIIDNVDNYNGVNGEDEMRAVTPYTPPQSCCPCPSHNPTNWVCSIEAISDNLRIFEGSNKTSRIFSEHQINQRQTVYIEGIVSSSTSQVDYVDWKLEGLTEDGSGGFVPTNIIIRSVYTVIDLKAAPVRLEPVTVATNEQGTILNPCGVATEGLAMYKVDVVPPGIVPDSAIHWSVASGDVSFYQSHDTGRTAIIRGGDTPDSDFKLEVQIDGLPSTYKPYIFGRVLEPKTVQVRAYVICDTNGVAAVSNSTVNDWIAEANRIYRQVAMTFTLASINSVTNQDWLVINDDSEFYQMTSYTENTGGLELYCVNTFYGTAAGKSNPTSISGARRGIAVKLEAPLMTFAHEVGHACFLDDIYLDYLDDSLISQERAGALNWTGGDGTGYYPPDLTHKNFIRRLLLFGNGGDGSSDISFGPVTAKMRVEPFYDTPYSTGLLNSMTRPPEH